MRGTWGVFVVALCVGCKKEPTKAPRLYTDAELATMADGLDARLEENRTKVCKRPVLRGTPTPGPADADLLALAEPTGALAACRKLITDQGLVLKDHLTAPLGTPLPAEVADAPKLCADVAAAISRAVQHEDACTPYLIGRRAEPVADDLTAFIGLGKAAVLRARELAQTGKVAEAIALLLDTARAGQDFGRDGAVLVGMIGHATSGLAVRAAKLILETDVALTASELEGIDREVALLIAGEPHVRSMFAAEADLARLQFTLPTLKPADWVPPGGWPPDMKRPTAEDTVPFDTRDYAGMMWEVAGRWSGSLLAGCPETASQEACSVAAAAAVKANAGKIVDPAVDASDLRSVAEAAGFVRDKVIDTLAVVATPTFADMMRNYPARTLSFVQLRLQIVVRQRLLGGGACPTLADAASFATALDAPALGALTVDQTPDGLVLEPPAWMGKARKPADLALACPLRE